MLNRRSAIAMLAAAGSALASGLHAQPRRPVTTDEVAMGAANAPITVVEFASVACPVCARFNNEVFPDFKKKYIDTGQVRFVTREILAHNPNLAAYGFMIARCAGQDKYFEVTDAVYHAQAEMEASGKYGEGLLKIGKDAGLTEAEINACISDRANIDALNARVAKNSRDLVAVSPDGRGSTPTFVINGVTTKGFQTLEQMDRLIVAARAARASP